MTGEVNPEPGGQAVLESSLLGVIDWWLGNHTREEVLVLINRHFRPEEVFDAHKLLAQACKLNDPIKHKNSALRKAGEVQAVDLVNDMDRLDLGKTGPRCPGTSYQVTS